MALSARDTHGNSISIGKGKQRLPYFFRSSWHLFAGCSCATGQKSVSEGLRKLGSVVLFAYLPSLTVC